MVHKGEIFSGVNAEYFKKLVGLYNRPTTSSPIVMPTAPNQETWRDEFKAIANEIAENIGEGSGGPNIIVQGPIYGWDDFVDKVRQAGINLKRRGNQ
jgi:hypothetical protein